jgi:hypothetical protein
VAIAADEVETILRHAVPPKVPRTRGIHLPPASSQMRRWRRSRRVPFSHVEETRWRDRS